MRDGAEPTPGQALDPGSLVQPVSAGLLAAIVGFGSSFTVVLEGLRSVGATPAEAASGLTALCFGQGLLAIYLSLRTRLPIAIAWSTPGAALLIASGLPEGGFNVAVGAFLLMGGMVVVAGLWRPFGRAVAAIPINLAAAMLAGVLLQLCLAPMKAVAAMPDLALPIVVAFALGWRFARLYAVPIAVAVTALIVLVATPVPDGGFAAPWPQLVPVMPAFSFHGVIGIAIPLFIVTMASQNVPGLAVLNANGYRPAPGPLFVATGLATLATAPVGGQGLNLAAITAALCAGPDAHPDPTRRFLASTSAGVAYLLLGLFAGVAAAFITASPPLLIQAVAGLALLGSLGGALSAALASDEGRFPAVVTFVTTASGISFFGIGAAFWGLLAGGLLMALDAAGRR